MDAPAGMDPLQRARYDAAMQRYRDTVAAHRATFESELRKAKDALAELNRRHRSKRTAPVGAAGSGGDAGGVGTERERGMNRSGADPNPHRVRAAGGPVQSILNKGG